MPQRDKLIGDLEAHRFTYPHHHIKLILRKMESPMIHDSRYGEVIASSRMLGSKSTVTYDGLLEAFIVDVQDCFNRIIDPTVTEVALFLLQVPDGSKDAYIVRYGRVYHPTPVMENWCLAKL